MQTIFDKYGEERITKLLSIVTLHIAEGRGKEHILSELGCEEELYSIAKARIKGSLKNKDAAKLYFNETDLRFATSDVIAEYRATRLKCNVIADIGCSTGFQSIAFAKTCKKVYAIDLDFRKIEYAKRNAKKLGITNIEFIHGDALDDTILHKIKDSEIIFCDPERLPEETERNIESIRPNIKIFFKKYEKITDRIALELPPQIRSIPFDCEKEYLSVNHELNRLNLYFGSLKKCNRSVMMLPQKKSICFNGTNDLKLTKVNVRKYVYEVDQAVERAELTGYLASTHGDLGLISSDKGVFLSSKDKISADFFAAAFEVLDECEKDKEKILYFLKKNDAIKVIIRYNIDPAEYWKERTAFEKGLTGKETVYLFNFGKIYLCKKL